MLTGPLEFAVVWLVAHGGTGGLIVELLALAGLLAVGLAVWRRSAASASGSAAGDEARVEE